MKVRTSVKPEEIVKIFEEVERVAGTLGIEYDSSGIILNVRKGVFSRETRKQPVSYILVEVGNEKVITFIVPGNLEPILRARIRKNDKGTVIETECLGEGSLCKAIEKILQVIATRARELLRKEEPPTSTFSLGNRYAPLIDGLAEVTLASLYLKYPLLDRRIARLEDVKNLGEFLEELYRMYGSRAKEILVHIETTSWRFILAIDFASRTYTPSFIENSTRIVGEEAIGKLMTKREEFVTLTIFAMSS